MAHKLLRWSLVMLIALLAVGVPLGGAAADVGPKPTIEFVFVQDFEGTPVTIVSGTLMQCEQADCSDAQPLGENMGPQHFTCEAMSCSGLAYGFSEYGRIDITFSDGKLRESNVFAITDFNAAYDVTIREDDLLVTRRFATGDKGDTVYRPPLVGLVLLCVVLGLMVLLAAGIVVLLLRRTRKA